MSLLPTATFATAATGEVLSQFNYFSRPVIIYKEAQETIVNPPDNFLYGYDPATQTDNTQITLSGVSQTFSGLIIPPLKSRGNSTAIFDNKIFLDDNKTYLKLLSPAKNYIENGVKTEKLEVDGLTYNIEGTAQTAYYLGLQFFYYQIKTTT